MNADVILRNAVDHVLRTDPDLSVGTVYAYYALRRALREVRRPLHTVCAWCQTVIREGSLPTSHGICSHCLDGVQRGE